MSQQPDPDQPIPVSQPLSLESEVQPVVPKKGRRPSQPRIIAVSLIYSFLAAALLFVLFANVVQGRIPSPSPTATPDAVMSNFTGVLETKPMPTAPPGAKPPTGRSTPNPQGSGLPGGGGGPLIYYGVHVPLQDMSSVASFEADANKAVSIVMWYQHWGVTDGYQYFQPSWLDAVRAHGSIPLITWDPWNPSQGANQPTYSLQNIINGNFDSYITQWAQASKAWGHPYFLRFAHEMNGYWMPWSEQVNGNKPGQFVQAWRHVHNIFTAVGATNVTWAWTPNIDFSISEPLPGLYPGDAYVDWVGMSGYNWGTVNGHSWQSFSSVFQQTYNDILSITSNKPMMIAETASAEIAGNKAAWITDAFVNQLPHNFPRIRAFVWFNQVKETDWPIESSPAAQNAFASAIQLSVYASNLFGNLNISPIPVA